MNYLWKLRPYFRQTAGELVLGSLAGIVMNTAVVLPAILLGAALDKALALERGEATPGDVTLAALLLIGGTLLTEGPRVLKRWWLMTANARIRANLRADALRGTLSRPLADLHKASIGDQMARVVGDVEVLGVGVREFTIETWDTVLFSLSFVVAMFVIDARLSLFALAPVPVAMLIAHASGRWVSARTASAREANAALTASVQELLAGFRVLRFFGRGPAATAEVEKFSRAFAERNLSATRLRLGLPPLYSTLMMSGILFVIWQGGERVIDGAMSVGAFVGYLALYIRFVERGFRIPQMVNSIQSGGAAYARLEPMLASALTVAGEPPFSSFKPDHVAGSGRRERTSGRRLPGPIGVSLREVSFVYPGAARPALLDFTLEVAPGSIVAVTGPVGSGKSTLARALLGIYPIESGTVQLSASNGSKLDCEAGRAGYLPQDAQLFSGSVRENVLMAEASGDSELAAQAVRLAALDADIAGFLHGVDTQVGELGVRISGGQRQRLGLARAIAAYAPDFPGLLVLDDPFSAVDVETEARIVAALREAFGPQRPHSERATILICSQRLAAFPQADRVVVLEMGRIGEQGSHAELLARGGMYSRIYRAQMRSDFPLAERASMSVVAAGVFPAREGPGRQLARLVRPWRRTLMVITLLVLGGALFELLPPLLIRSIVDDHLAVGRSDGLLVLALLYLGATALGQSLAFVYGYLAATVAQGVLSALRVRLFAHLQRLPADYFDRTPIGDAISRCTADIDTLDTVFTSGVATLVANLVRLLTIAAAMVILSPTLSLAAAVVLPPLVVVTRFFQVRIRNAERANRRAVGEMNVHLQETLRGIEVIQAFRREAGFVDRFRRVLQRVLQASNRATAYSSFYPPVTAVMTYSAIAFLLWAGTRDGFGALDISIGTLTAFALLLQRFFAPVTALGDEWQTVQGALSGAERIFEVLALPAAGQTPPPVREQRREGLVCEDVVFAYTPGTPVLHGVTLHVAPGEHVALVGRTGAGKTSIVHLLAGLYQPARGTVRIAGHDPSALSDEEKRGVFGIVPQASQLFNGTVLENLALKDETVPEAAVVEAAKISGADAFIRALPNGYRTVLRGSGRGAGVQLSAGQEQLLTLTRALVSRPRVLLFDEATSFVDGATEAALRDALRATVLTRGTAVLTVAHRLATAREADRVVVIDHGRIIEDGAPADLVAQGGRFAALLELEAAGWDWRHASGQPAP